MCKKMHAFVIVFMKVRRKMTNIFPSLNGDRAIIGNFPVRLFFCGPYTWLRLIFLLAAWLLGHFLECAAALRSVCKRQEMKNRTHGQLPLPPGSLGLPFIGEMFQFIIQVLVIKTIIRPIV